MRVKKQVARTTQVIKKKAKVRQPNRIPPAEASKRRFLKCLAEYPSVLDASKRAKVSRTTMYALRDRHPEFAAAWDEARLRGTDVLERIAVKRAMEGDDVPIIYQGKIQTDKAGTVVTVKRVSDILLMFQIGRAHF